jgi:hypothetical protein
VAIWLQDAVEEGLLNEGKSGGSVFRHPLMFQPPPQAEDGPKEEKSNIYRQGTDYNHSTAKITLIPTRFLGVNICLKEVSCNSSPCGHRRRRKALIFEHPPPTL